MPGTYSQLIGGIIRAEKGVVFGIGGVEDHVHLYFRWRPDGSVSDLMRTIKSRSSKWEHDTYPKLAAFGWQEGYSVFSVSKSQEAAVKNYIARQAEHHGQEDFKSELLRMFHAHDVEFEERSCSTELESADVSSAPPGQVRQLTIGPTGSAALHPWL